MTAWIFALAAIGFVIVLSILTYHLVLTLKQTRMTARAAEQFLIVTRPRLEDTVLQVNQILSHTNRIVLQAEQTDSGKMTAGLVRNVSHIVAYARAAVHAMQLVKGLKSTLVETWHESRRESRRRERPGHGEVRYELGG